MLTKLRDLPRSRKIIRLVLIALLALVLALAAIMRGLGPARRVTVGRADASALSDGTYLGTYDYGRWSCAVAVTVSNGRMEAIEVVDDVTAAFITDCADEMVGRVLAAQSTDVDLVSGATATSKAYLKAIEDALS